MFEWARNHCWPEETGVFRAPNRFWLAAGCLGAFGYAFFALQFTSMDQPFRNLMVLAFAVSFFYAPKAARTDPVVFLALGAAILGVFSYVQSNLLIPAYAEPQPYINKAMGPFTLFVMAWWLGGSVRNVVLALVLALAGMWVAVLGHEGFGDFARGLAGERADFGFWNAEHAGVFVGTALIGWTVFAPRITRGRSVTGRSVRIAIWVVMLLVLFLCVVLTQARAAWLGLAAALPVGLVAAVLYARSRAGIVRPAVVMVCVAVVAVAALGPTTTRIVSQRLAQEREFVDMVGRTGVSQLPDTSIGIRLKLWNEGMASFAERPWTGWGYTARNHYIKESKTLPASIRDNFGHVHSSYFEVLLAYGIPGLLLMGALVITVGLRAWRRWRAGAMPFDVLLFGGCFIVFFLVVCAFESYVFGKTGAYLTTLVGGAIYTFVLAERQRRSAVDS